MGNEIISVTGAGFLFIIKARKQAPRKWALSYLHRSYERMNTKSKKQLLAMNDTTNTDKKRKNIRAHS